MVKVLSSAIRDLLAVVDRPGMISLAGGLPAPESFPVEAVAAATSRVLSSAALQYSASQGDEALRCWVATQRGLGLSAADVVVTAGSQQALDLVSRSVLDPGDVVALADPGYVGAIEAFRLAGASLAGIPSDEEGLIVEVLAERCRRGQVPKLVYVVSNFANPGGATLSLPRRQQLAALADRFGFLILDDDPYGELRWRGSAVPPLASMTARVVWLGTMSKVLAPGLRVGFASGPAEAVAELVLLKQAADLHTSTLSQRIAHEVVSCDPSGWTAHLAQLRVLYQAKADALVAALEARLGDRIRFARPDGGMFVWATLPGVDTTDLLDRAVAAGVAFVPGSAFAVDAVGHAESLRLSFATVSPAELDEGVRRLVSVLDS
jgi:2-aminoadipate transaminase